MKNKIDKAANTISSSNKFLHELKRIVITIVTYVVLGFIVYENRDILIDQATKTVIHREVVEEVDHLPRFEEWKEDKKEIYRRLNAQYKQIQKNEAKIEKVKIKPVYRVLKRDSLHIYKIYNRLDYLKSLH